MNTEIKNLIRVIKFAPLFVILFVCISIIGLMYQELENDFKNETQLIKTQNIENEKKSIYGSINTIHNYIKNEKQISERELKIDLKSKINNVYKIAKNIYFKNKDTHTKNEIIKLIKDAVVDIRFQGGSGYFSIHTIEGINILHPITREFEGTSVLNRKDAKGNYPVQNAIKIAKTKGEGFFTWYYLKPSDKSKEFKKVGIVKKFEPYNFIITTAVYFDDYE